ncbi:MAG: N-acetyltransferase DgcN [Sedimenticolaceae bacterium]
MNIQTPYLLFLGDAADPLAAKVAQGICDWRPDSAIGQLRMQGCNADLGLQDMTVSQAVAAGAKTLVVGVANRGGVISNDWIEILRDALAQGMDVAAGLHNRLVDVPALKVHAVRMGRQLFDVRHPTQRFDVASGTKRRGKRLLPVGTDCSCGKMYTALAIEKELRSRGLKADFRATGQTGILIAGRGVCVDAVVADFISGAVEWLSPDNDDDHWDIVEGQGSLFHPSFAGVTTGLIHGAQPDVLVLCHEPTRTHMRGLPSFPIPDLKECMDAAVRVARLTNPHAEFIGVAVDTSRLGEQEADAYLKKTEQDLGLVTVDPVRNGVARIADQMI